jgi:hypothetical protein
VLLVIGWAEAGRGWAEAGPVRGALSWVRLAQPLAGRWRMRMAARACCDDEGGRCANAVTLLVGRRVGWLGGRSSLFEGLSISAGQWGSGQAGHELDCRERGDEGLGRVAVWLASGPVSRSVPTADLVSGCTRRLGG